jgi:hypothetical protein
MTRTYSSIDKIRAELAWVNETADPNKCGCRMFDALRKQDGCGDRAPQRTKRLDAVTFLDLPPSRFIGQSSKTKLAHSYCDCGTLVYSLLDTFVASSAGNPKAISCGKG